MRVAYITQTVRENMNMNQKRINIILFVILIAISLGTSFAYSAEKKLRIVYSEVEFFPYQMGNGRTIADPPGISLELIVHAAQAITTDHHVESGQYGEIVKVPTPLATKDYFLMFSNQFMKQHSDIAEQLWTKIAQIRDHKTKALMPKYKPTTE